MVTIVDYTSQVNFQNEKEENELLKTINATVNHELRNPLNAIVATNEHKQFIYKELETVLYNELLENELKIETTKD